MPKYAEEILAAVTELQLSLIHISQLIQRFGIDTIPTLMLFKDGEVIGSIVAPGSKAAIEKMCIRDRPIGRRCCFLRS